jgi:hypothetical protein
MRFEALREILLKGGVAPRHVRRYLAELSEHLDDLTEKQRAQGYDGEDAALRARALLGEDRELAAAMLEQKPLRSITARVPWLVFGLLPPVAGIAASFALIAPLALVAHIFHMVTHGSIHAPRWFQGLVFTVTGVGNLSLAPLLAAGFVFLAARQRIFWLWPLLAVLLLVLLDLQFHADFAAPGHRGGSLNINAVLWVSHANILLDYWRMSLAQLLLTIAPISWLVRQHLAIGKR